MKKKEFLILLVQTWVLARGSKRSDDPLHRARFAVFTLDYLRRLLDKMGEHQLPADLASAAEEFCFWQDQSGGDNIPRPKWLPEKD